jgi:hypothetical protein
MRAPSLLLAALLLGASADGSINGGAYQPVGSAPDDVRRIMGGEEAIEGWFPYVANKGKDCGGALIASQWIITAAHCGTQVQPLPHGPALSTCFPQVGELWKYNRYNINLNTEEFAEHGRTVEVVTHPGYGPDSESDDLALVYLDTPAKVSPRLAPSDSPAQYTLPIRLATEAEAEALEAPEQLLTVAGWGQTGPNNKQVDKLRYVRRRSLSLLISLRR